MSCCDDIPREVVKRLGEVTITVTPTAPPGTIGAPVIVSYEDLNVTLDGESGGLSVNEIRSSLPNGPIFLPVPFRGTARLTLLAVIRRTNFQSNLLKKCAGRDGPWFEEWECTFEEETILLLQGWYFPLKRTTRTRTEHCDGDFCWSKLRDTAIDVITIVGAIFAIVQAARKKKTSGTLDSSTPRTAMASESGVMEAIEQLALTAPEDLRLPTPAEVELVLGALRTRQAEPPPPPWSGKMQVSTLAEIVEAIRLITVSTDTGFAELLMSLPAVQQGSIELNQLRSAVTELVTRQQSRSGLGFDVAAVLGSLASHAYNASVDPCVSREDACRALAILAIDEYQSSGGWPSQRLSVSAALPTHSASKRTPSPGGPSTSAGTRARRRNPS